MPSPAPQPAAVPPALAAVEWLVERAQLPEDVLPLVEGADDGDVLMQRLIDGGHAADAVRVVAAALPPREGVWWAWVAARHASQHLQGKKGAAAQEALAAVERWVTSPEDGPRRAAWAASEKAGADAAAGCTAAAAFFTGGSVAAAEVAPVPPPPGLNNIMVGIAVTLAAAADPANSDGLLAAYLAQGTEIVKRLGGWEGATLLARQHFDAQGALFAKAVAAAAPGAKAK